MTYCDRTEEAKIKLTLKGKDTVARHKLALKVLLGVPCSVSDSDTQLKVTWSLFLHYLEDTAIHLDAVDSILQDEEVVVDAECEALENGKILVYNVLKRLESTIAKIRSNAQPVQVVADDEATNIRLMREILERLRELYKETQ